MFPPDTECPRCRLEFGEADLLLDEAEGQYFVYCPNPLCVERIPVSLDGGTWVVSK